MGLKELYEKLNKLLADGKKLMHYYGEFDDLCRWANIVGVGFDGDRLIFYTSDGFSILVIAASDDDFVAKYGELIGNLSYYDELLNPSDVLLGTNKGKL